MLVAVALVGGPSLVPGAPPARVVAAAQAAPCRSDAQVAGLGRTAADQGLWLGEANTEVTNFGDAAALRGTAALAAAPDVVALTATRTGRGYWLARSDGTVHGFGDAGLFGSPPRTRLPSPIVDIAGTVSGRGYYLVTQTANVYTFGDAVFFGSTGAAPIPSPVVDMQLSPSGKGYWLLTSTGTVYGFGDAQVLGSAAAPRLVGPAADMTATPTGRGYVILAANGDVFPFGDAPVFGSGKVGEDLPAGTTYTDIEATSTGKGYWAADRGGAVFSAGDAFAADSPTNAPAIACVQPAALDFGESPLRVAAPRQTFTVTSVGLAVLAIASVDIAGAAGPDFTRTADSCTGRRLRAGRSCSVEIEFRPLVTGDRQASASVRSTGATAAVDLRGRGLGSGSTVTTATTAAPSQARLTVDPGLGHPGFVVQASGSGFRPLADIVLTWVPGIGQVQARSDAAGSFRVAVLVFPHDLPGPRQLRGSDGTTTAVAEFLVVPDSGQPRDITIHR